jgi:uncharacterized protein YcgL (UPF0745 family)
MGSDAECFIGAAFAATIASAKQRIPMQAYVYKSRRKSDTYVYLRERDGFGLIPEPLRASLGGLDFVLEVELAPDRKLAQADPAVVRTNLAAHGFHLQFPPQPDGAHPAPVIEYPSDMAALTPTPASPGDTLVQGDATHGDA